MKIENANEFVNADTRFGLERLSNDEILITYIDDIWDGPLAGSCSWKGSEYYFYAFDQVGNDGSEDKWPRKYILINLTENQLEQVQKQRLLFKELLTKNVHKEEYVKTLEEAPPIRFLNDRIVGWFDSGNPQVNVSEFMKSYLSQVNNRNSHD